MNDALECVAAVGILPVIFLLLTNKEYRKKVKK